jgi:3-ketosteroid 9alpha-monooxygenase subunit B
MPAADQNQYHRLRIKDVIKETADTRSFILEIPSDLDDGFRYQAGQFCTFRANIEDQEVVRCYSMSSSPDIHEEFATTVKRVPGGTMSNWMIDSLSSGDTIEVMRPAGLFVLRDSEAPVVAFAGGSGITPVMSLLKTVLATTNRQVLLVYANRDRDSVIFASEIERLRTTSKGRLEVHSHFDSEAGFLDSEGCITLVGDRAHADFYVCGPGPYMDVVEAALERVGIAPRQLFIERFVVPGEVPTFLEGSATESVRFRLNRQRKTIDYLVGDSLLETARRAGLRPPFSCEGGSCATCMALLASGTAIMRVNNALTPEEVDQGWILTCQAIPTSREVSVDYDA